MLQSDPLIHEFSISIKEPETVSRFLGNFSYKTTHMLREINFKVFRKLLRKSKPKAITIDIDSSVVNVEGHQEGAVRGYNPKKPGSNCYNLQFAFCDELKAYITGFVRSCNTYTANGAAEMIKEIVAQIKTDDLEILFRMDSGYFDDDIITTIESAGCQYLIMQSTPLARAKSIQRSLLKSQHQPFHLRKVMKAGKQPSLLPNWTPGTKTGDLLYPAY